MIIGQNRRTKTALLAACAALAIVPATAYAQSKPQRVSYSIPAQDLGTALTELARQSNREIVFSADLTRGKRAPRLSGKMSFDQALARLLDGSGLRYRLNGSGSIVIETAGEEGNALAGDDAVADEDRGKADILVVGSRTQNVDIRRTQDDTLPYVVIGQDEIRRSAAPSLEDFLKSRLPMNASSSSFEQFEGNFASPQGGINLRGLGSNQTLVLVDGRRVPSVSTAGIGFQQPNLAGIPLASIERIEVLPSTAGAIYGGSAVGGVINIIRKSAYRGLDVRLSYGNSFKWDVDSYNIDVVGGTSFNSGKTNISFTLSHSGSSNPLYAYERSFINDSRRLAFNNAPTQLVAAILPPLGVTPNICSALALSATTGICRSSSPLTLKDGRTLPSGFTFVPPGYSGPNSDSGSGLLADAGAYNLSFPQTPNFLLQSPDRYFASFDGRHQFNSWLSVFANASYALVKTDMTNGSVALNVLIPNTSANNPFQQAVEATIYVPGLTKPVKDRTESYSASGGLILRPSSKWSAILEHDWSKSQYSYKSRVGSLLSDAGISLLRDRAFQANAGENLNTYFQTAFDNFVGPVATILDTSNLRVSGTPLKLPAGPINITALMEQRDQRSQAAYSVTPTTVSLFPPRSQRVQSLYLEGLVPLLSSKQNIPFVDTLELQASVRHDRYNTRTTVSSVAAPTINSTFPSYSYVTSKLSSTDWLLGLKYLPVRGVIFRGSIGTGFLPPDLYRLVPFPTTLRSPVTDPRRGGQLVATGIPEFTQGHAGLQPEISKTWSFGIILEPRAIRGLRLSADYTRIRKRNEITVSNEQFILNNEAVFPDRVTRGASLPGDPAGYAGPVTMIDAGAFNLLRSDVRALDFQLDFSRNIGTLGEFHVYTAATRMLRFQHQLATTTPFYNAVGYPVVGGPLKWKGNASLEWRKGPWGASWDAQYYGPYYVTSPDPGGLSGNAAIVLRQGSDKIPAQIYNDMSLRYAVPEKSGALKGVEIMFTVQNIFNKQPPIVVPADYNTTVTYSTYGDPRLRRFVFTIQKSFGN